MAAGSPSRFGSTHSARDAGSPSRACTVKVSQLPLWPQMASLDWPPPPSPQHAFASGSPKGGYGVSIVGSFGSDKFGLNEKVISSSQHRPNSRPSEVIARAKLWSLRGEIDANKLREVVSYPFLNNPMQFQDESAGLQITTDGRFSFSTLACESDTGDVVGGAEAAARTVVTHEGVLCNPRTGNPMLEPFKHDPEVAVVEGRGMIRLQTEDVDGRTRVISVEGGICRFAISVNPFFAPKTATVQLQDGISISGRPAPRIRRLQWVGPGTSIEHDEKNKISSECRPQRRCGYTLKFSRSGGGFSQQSKDQSGTPRSGDVVDRRALPSLSSSFSAPQLAPLSSDKQKSVNDWKEFYRQRAQTMLSNREQQA
eukprot:TRINITY_DN8780_c0_g1_i1.p1 TRINITY_DN8780_c0_g1~~TRINITY_DN8780_c0_g1_i1.p1  ORF type:complete len:386 (+),score=25.06 TRINITY_DN8780_c0_g1_i1:53-1159(+)